MYITEKVEKDREIPEETSTSQLQKKKKVKQPKWPMGPMLNSSFLSYEAAKSIATPPWMGC